MAIYRSNRPHHILSRQEKLDLFRNCTVVHPHLKNAYEELRDAVNNPGGASIIFLFGPTGVGYLIQENNNKQQQQRSIFFTLCNFNLLQKLVCTA